MHIKANTLPPQVKPHILQNMSLPKPTIVIFDMDGTSVRHINLYLLHILERLDDAAYATTRLFTWIFKRHAKGPAIPEWEHYKNRKKPRLFVHRAIHRLRRKDVDQIVEPCPGIYDVLDFLKNHDIPLALASNGLGKGYGHDILKKFELDSYFSATIFREHIKHSKPDPESLLLCLKKMKITPGKEDVIWYIGDRPKDVKAALNAAKQLDCTVEPIAYGVNAAISILKAGLSPDHIIMSHFDMKEVLEERLGSATAKKRLAKQSHKKD